MMTANDNFPTVKVAVIQAAPVLFDREASVDKACQLIHEAAAQGAQLVLFPEAFIPAYPRGDSPLARWWAAAAPKDGAPGNATGPTP